MEKREQSIRGMMNSEVTQNGCYFVVHHSLVRLFECSRLPLIIIHLTLIILYSSCYTPTDGCLDVDATNFDASADESCEDCCNYPQLNLSIFHSITAEGILGDTCINHSADSTFNFVDDNFFQIEDISFYLSDFQIVMPNGDVSEVEDMITLSIYDNIIDQNDIDTLVKDDFVLIERGQFSYSVGEFRAPGTYAKVKFNVGISSALNSTDVDTLATTHPLSSSQEMHFDSRGAGFIFQNFSVVTDTTQSLTETTNFEIGAAFTTTIPIELDYVQTFEPGVDVEIPLKINYTTWLQGINFATDSEAAIKTRIVSNTASAFEIDQ